MKARIYAFDEVDRPEEIALALTELRQEVINELDALQTELKGCVRRKPERKRRGFVMKKVLLSIAVIGIVLGFGLVVNAQYVQSDINYDIASNPEKLAEYLRDTIGEVSVFRLTPTSEPTTQLLQGQLYYDTAGGLYLYDTTLDWVAVATASGNSLDGAYNAGATMDVDGDAVTLTTSDGDDNVVLALVQNEDTNDNGAMTIVMGTSATGTGLAINSQANGTDISGDNWSIDQAGKLTILEIAQTGDVLFNGTTYDVAFDASREGFVFEDNSILGFGATVHDDAPDMTFSSDATNVLVEVATQDGADLIFGSTNALDIMIYNDAADSTVLFDNSGEQVKLNGWDLEVQDGDFVTFGDSLDFTMTATNKVFTWQGLQTDESEAINIGANTDGMDVKLFGATTGSFILWDASGDELMVDKASISLSEGDAILFGDTLGTGDFTISSTSAVLTIAQVAADTGTIVIGADDTDVPITWNGETAGADVILTGDTMLFDAVDITIQDGDFLNFGDGADFSFTSATAKNLIVAAAGADELYEFHIGIDQSGVDLSLHGTTAGDILHWDASGDYLHMIGDSVLFTLAEAAQQFQVDATGTYAGDAIVLSTTDGGIMLDADGAVEGDIELNAVEDIMVTAGDDITVTAGGDLILAVTGTYNIAGSILTNTGVVTEVVTGTTDTITTAQSGSIIVYTMTGGACEATLPAAAAGLWFILIDGDPAAGEDLKITPVGDDGINGDTATNYILCENDRDGEGVVIFATSGTAWYTMACGSSTVWTEE